MRKYTKITNNLRNIIDGLPEKATYVGITIDRITWDIDKYNYDFPINHHDYINEEQFIYNLKFKKLI